MTESRNNYNCNAKPSQNYGKCLLNKSLLKQISQVSSQEHLNKHFHSDVKSITSYQTILLNYLNRQLRIHQFSKSHLLDLSWILMTLTVARNKEKHSHASFSTIHDILKVERESARVVITILWMNEYIVYTSINDAPTDQIQYGYSSSYGI